MVIVYHGNVESLRMEFAQVEDTLNKRYEEILGAERARLVREAAARLLTPQSFFDTPEQYEQRTGKKFPKKASNKILMATAHDLELDEHYRIKGRKIQTAIGFYISPSGFEASGSSTFTDRQIASYVHEYDHFIWYVLQRRPLYLINSFIKSHIQPDSEAYLDMDRFNASLEASDMDISEKIQRFYLAVFHENMDEVYEYSNRILDRLILESIGIEVPLHWRGKPRQYETIPLPSVSFAQATGIDLPFAHLAPGPRAVQFPVGGDPFKAWDDRTVVDYVIEWEQHFAHMTPSISIQNLLASLASIKVTRVQFESMMKLQDKDKAKSKRKKGNKKRKNRKQNK